MVADRRLIAYAQLGLGNRMRVILSSLAYARSQDRDFEYVWDSSVGMKPALTDLWEFPYRRVSPLQSRLLWLTGHRYVKDRTADWPADVEAKPLIQVKTVHALKDDAGEPIEWGRELRELETTGAVQDRIFRIWNDTLAGRPYIGVQIRAHDAHPKTVEASPVEWFIGRMQELRAENPNVQFFLSSDSEAATRQVIDAIGPVAVQTDIGDYHTTKRVQAAVADLYLLGSAAGVLGPYWSSFVSVARRLADDAVVMEDSRNDHRLSAVGLKGASVADPLRPWERMSDRADSV